LRRIDAMYGQATKDLQAISTSSAVGSSGVTDPIHVELVKNALTTIGDEMGLAVVRSAYSSQVKEGGDSTAAIFDHTGRLLAQSSGAGVTHLASLRPGLREVMHDFPPETMCEGDIYICNDPYRGGIHSNDVMVFRPSFFEDELAFFTASLFHVADIGGMAAGGLPANATELYHEGLILPPVRFHHAGEPERAVIDIIAANSRTPGKVLGDIQAMIAGDYLGAQRLVELTQRYGLARIRKLVNELLDYTDRRTRLEIAALPDGSHEGSFVIDDDGVEIGKGHTVRAKVTIEGDRFRADFTGTDPQSKGPINAAPSQSLSAVLFVVRSLLSGDIPMNDGAFWAIDVNFPRGSLCNPNPPAACNSRMATVMAMAEAMLRALSEIVPGARIAASSNVHVASLSGMDGKTGRIWTCNDPQFGGGGARGDRDGNDVFGSLIFSTTAFHCIEAYEMEYPIRFEQFEFWNDSGGPGRWRGGQGSRRDVRFLTSGTFTGRATDRCRIPPPGVSGGLPGRGGGWVLNEGSSKEQPLPMRVTSLSVEAGDVITMRTSSGGGFGPPAEREPSRVLEDVIDGNVSIESAREIYRVSIDPATLTVREDETEALRGALS
jgi:N-methylhydantoinase B